MDNEEKTVSERLDMLENTIWKVADVIDSLSTTLKSQDGFNSSVNAVLAEQEIVAKSISILLKDIHKDVQKPAEHKTQKI